MDTNVKGYRCLSSDEARLLVSLRPEVVCYGLRGDPPRGEVCNLAAYAKEWLLTEGMKTYQLYIKLDEEAT